MLTFAQLFNNEFPNQKVPTFKLKKEEKFGSQIGIEGYSS